MPGNNRSSPGWIDRFKEIAITHIYYRKMERLSATQIEERIKELPGWTYTGSTIETNLKFKDFREAFSVMTRIAFECETLNHHPDWKNVYNQLHIALNTHDAQGITEKDFQLAHQIRNIISN